MTLVAAGAGCRDTDDNLCVDNDRDGICDDVEVNGGDGGTCPDVNGDGICDGNEPCPAPDGDADGDGVCNSVDICLGFDDTHDFDFDGVPDGCDACPADPGNDSDQDGDGVCDFDDVCPGFDDTHDFDGDGLADGCDACPLDNPDDSDGDGVCDVDDACPGFDDAVDEDGDGLADACDLCPVDNPDDSDGDGVCDADDLCPGAFDSSDFDADGVPDACDLCPADALDDSDGDGSCDSEDLCPGFDDAADADGDGAPDDCDSCPADNPDDSDGDTVCDAVDVCPGGDDRFDTDADGVADACDACPLDALDDSDGDTVCDTGDRCPGFDDLADGDGDGAADGCDVCPLDDPNDSDGDAVCDSDDPCPFDYPNDTDGDGVCDSTDPCPVDNPDDTDGDGVCDTGDPCPFDNPDDADGDGFCDSQVTLDPAIDWITPSAGSTGGGYLIQIAGANFLAGALVELGSDAGGWARATGVQVRNGGTLIVAEAPSYPAGLVTVRVTNTDGRSAELIDGFEYLAPQGLPGLDVLSVAPTRGPNSGGYEVMISGQGFVAGVEVYWGDDFLNSWVASPSVQRLGPTLLRVIMPNYGTDGEVDLRVSNPTFPNPEELVLSDAFTFGQAVVLTPFGQRLPNDLLTGDDDVVVFDANGDGLSDILVTHTSTADPEELYINTLDSAGNPGLFVDQGATNMPGGMNSYRNRRHPVAHDLDNDGDLDVLFHYDIGLAMYENAGDGTFSVRSLGTGPIQSATDLVPADYNCDGMDDILVVRNNRENVIFLGDGSGNFTAADPGTLPAHVEPSEGAAAGDVDNDGDMDLLIANDTAFQNRLYYNNCANISAGETWQFADAAYGTGMNFPVSGFNTRDALLHDVNGDGLLDAILINNGQTQRFYLNTGGSFDNDTGGLFPQSEANSDAYEGVLADLDLDGDQDLILRKRMDINIWWPFVYLSDLAQGGAGGYTDVSDLNMPAWRGEDAKAMGVGDFDGDSLPDLFVLNRDHQDWLLMNNGYAENVPIAPGNRVPPGAYANNTAWGFPEDARDTWVAELGDLDGDGDVDIVLGHATPEGGIDIWMNDGAGSFFSEGINRLPPVECAARGITLADLNGDGDLDMIVACTSLTSPPYPRGNVFQFVNDGFGFFVDLTSVNMPAMANGRYTGVDSGDMENDGDTDLVVTVSNSGTQMLMSVGDAYNNDGALFLIRNDRFPGALSNCTSPLVTDFNYDGFPDLYLARSGQNFLLYNDGTGALADVTATHLPAVSDTSTYAMNHDLDFDGDMELYVVNEGADRLHAGELDYKFADATASLLPTDNNSISRSGALVDLDADGLMDVVTAVWGDQNRLLLNVGGGQLADFSDNMPPDSDRARCIRIADLDGNGVDDIFVANELFNRIYLNFTPLP